MCIMISMKRWVVIIIGLLLAANCIAATHYVVPPGTAGVTPTDPFTNWVTAGTSIVEVVNAAVTNTGGRLVWVTNGTYYPTASIFVANASSFRLQSVNGRDKTILNGSQTTNRCTYFDYQSSYCVFDGFTVTNYYYSPDMGRGTVYGPRITVINCLFEGNTNLTGYGGAIMDGAGNSTITNCIFRNNYSIYGGAVYIAGGYPGQCTRITDCRFEGNRAGTYYGGGVMFASSNIIVSNCVFISNSVSSRGGAILIGSLSTNNLIVNCTFTGNIVDCKGAEKRGYGGGIVNYGETTIRNCSIIGNIATNIGGGIYAETPAGTNTMIINCLIARNQSSTNIGGGIWMTNGIVESCTIVSNYAKIAGGGVYIDGSGSGTNNIIYFNTTTNTDTIAANFTNTAGNAGLIHSCVIPAVAGTGNITNNPVLKNLAGGDYRLRMTSPCVNTGTNQSWMMNAVDLQGNARILKIIVDMGAYETRLWQGTIFSVP